MERLIAPSMLSADFGNLDRDVEMVNRSVADWFHLDIMDGVFVPNISFGFPVVKAIAAKAKKTLDAHLMITEPERYVTRFAEAGVHYLSFHFEATSDSQSVIDLIHSSEMKAGLAIKPATDVSVLEPYIKSLDYILIMSVEPGYSGQKFMPVALEKAKEVRKMVDKLNPECLIQMDGGISPSNIDEVEASGVDVFVAASAIFNSPDPNETISIIKCRKSL